MEGTSETRGGESGLEDAMKDTHPDDLHTMGLTGSRVKLQNLRAGGIELTGFGDQRKLISGRTHL